MVIITKSLNETIKVGEKIGNILLPGDIVLLEGDLGAGKTHLVKGIATALGSTDYVTSPTFTILNIYKGNGININHFDVYRINDEEELLNIGFDDHIFSKDISIVEWANLIRGLYPDKYLSINIEVTKENERRIIIDDENFRPIKEELI